MSRAWLVAVVLCAVAAADSLYVGRVDTVGGTTYDWFTNGPVYRWLVNSEPWGIHAVWMASADSSPWPDRNKRYNFYDYVTRAWLFRDTLEFMASGAGIYSSRAGFGNAGADPMTGVAIAVAHGGTPIRPIAARDDAPGTAVFDYCDGSPNAEGMQWPVLAVGQGGIIHVAGIDNATQDQLWYSRIVTWCTWETPERLSGGGVPDPMFPTHNIAASLISGNVCVCWVDAASTTYEPAYYRISTDAGVTWQSPVELPPPPAYGGDTVASFFVTSLSPCYDRHDRLHFVADVHPVVHDTMYIMPAKIWHWCGSNNPPWSEVHRAACLPEHIRCSIGYNALYAGRPSIGEDAYGNLLVAWEQFDSINYEPQTNLLRAGIWLSSSEDSGITWAPGRMITGINSVSHRYPCVMDFVSQDTVCVLYLMDLVAGANILGQGPLTANPVACQFVATGLIRAGVSERGDARLERGRASIVRGMLTVSTAADRRFPLALRDVSGRTVARLRAGPNDVSRLAPGVYFVVSGPDAGSIWRVVIAW